jgi:hypothetical protein
LWDQIADHTADDITARLRGSAIDCSTMSPPCKSRPIGGRVFCPELDHLIVRPAHRGQLSNHSSMPGADVALGQYGSSSAEGPAH